MAAVVVRAAMAAAAYSAIVAVSWAWIHGRLASDRGLVATRLYGWHNGYKSDDRISGFFFSISLPPHGQPVCL